MNKLTINRQNGNVPRSLEGKDHVSGFIFYVTSTVAKAHAAKVKEFTGDIDGGFSIDESASSPSVMYPCSVIDAAEAVGITSDSETWEYRLIHYQLSETFRLNPGISLYVGVFTKPETHTFAEIKKLQNFADGAIRQVAIWDGSTAMSAANVALLQSVGNALDLEAAPLSILYAPKVTKYSSLPGDAAVNSERVSVVIAQDGEGTGATLFKTGNTNKCSVSAIGIALGHLSSAAVHESISWVKKFPSGVSLPALSDGTEVRNIDKAALEQLDTKRYLFLTPIVGIAGSYWNDSHNMDSAISDYAFIENVRTMDKAVRGIRTYVTPELGGNVYVDPETGKLQAFSREHLETTANKALEDMNKAGELSGYEAAIDAEQDVLSTSTVEIVIKNVPVGVMRKINVKIGYVKSL